MSGIGLPEKWAMMLPYAPFYIGVVPALLELRAMMGSTETDEPTQLGAPRSSRFFSIVACAASDETAHAVSHDR